MTRTTAPSSLSPEALIDVLPETVRNDLDNRCRPTRFRAIHIADLGTLPELT